jgi:three-Cys-motif partner protein
MTGLTVASDGLVARPLPDWTREKLFYIERYLDIFCTAMRGKWTLAYADLLAGPGICMDLATGDELPGSSLLAARRPEFERLFLNDMSPVIASALSTRTSATTDPRITISVGDCNTVVQQARDVMFPSSIQAHTLGLAVIDPEAFEMSYDAISRLTEGLRIDLIIIFMTGFVRRFISRPEFESPLDSFYGTNEWRSLVSQRNAGERVTYRKLLDLYADQLRKLGYQYVDDDARMLNSKRSTIYHIVFASRHTLGADFFRKIRQITYQGQRRLF